ncbi:MAG: hypothetical protein WD823_12210 [Sulfuricaulis sp.]|uniref:hypothetical protein n=1 Tax=Sulfuricaulis sp. TaxID=2003553 RepID=UPI0034A14BBE
MKVPIRKLFLVTIVTKIALSFLAWLLSSPWILGFWLPLAIMGGYIAIGLARRGDDVSDEKFGDSCYYLGFIFTIASIAFSLFDVPQLDQAGKLKEIAVRFGAAMVSTFLGIIVRIYLVGFRRDVDQAMDRLEERLVTAADELRGRMELSMDAFRQFENTVHDAAKDVVARSNMAFETLGKTFANEFTGALNQVTAQAKEVYLSAAGELRTAATTMSEDMRRSIQALDNDVRAREAESQRIIASLRVRVDAVAVPDDFFVRKLEPSVANFASAVTAVEQQMKGVASSLQESVGQARAALEELRTTMKASDVQLSTARKHEEVLTSLTARMTQASELLSSSAETISEQRRLVAELAAAGSEQRGANSEAARSLAQAAQLLSSSAEAIKEQRRLVADLSKGGSEQRRAETEAARSLAQAAQLLSSSATGINEQRRVVTDLSAAVSAQRSADNELARDIRGSAEQLAAAANTLQRGTETMLSVLQQLAAVKEQLANQAAIATATGKTAEVVRLPDVRELRQEGRLPSAVDAEARVPDGHRRSFVDWFRGR